MQLIRSAGGVVYFVDGISRIDLHDPLYSDSTERLAADHYSDNGWESDGMIDNNGSLELLRENVRYCSLKYLDNRQLLVAQ